MESEKDPLLHLQEIRSMMERSTKFISLSGMSGIVAGLTALIGAYVQYWYMLHNGRYCHGMNMNNEFIQVTVLNFLSVLLFAFLSAFYFTYKKAKKDNQSIWNSASQRLLTSVMIPLITGGLFCGVLFYYGLIGLLAPATLIFYGLALISGSTYTLRDIRHLGFIEIGLGFFAAFNIGLGLLFWAIGFGLLHIAYGVIMYYKYDRK